MHFRAPSSFLLFMHYLLSQPHVLHAAPVDQAAASIPDIAVNSTDSTPGLEAQITPMDNFIYSTVQHFTFNFTARQTAYPVGELKQLPLTRLEENLRRIIIKAFNKGDKPTDPIPDNLIFINDNDYTGSVLTLRGAQGVYDLRWTDMTAFGEAVRAYLAHWEEVRRAGNIIITMYNSANTLVAKGNTEKGWPYAPAPIINETTGVVA